MIASPEVANRKQFVAYFRLLHKLVLLNVSLDLAFIIVNLSFAVQMLNLCFITDSSFTFQGSS